MYNLRLTGECPPHHRRDSTTQSTAQTGGAGPQVTSAQCICHNVQFARNILNVRASFGLRVGSRTFIDRPHTVGVMARSTMFLGVEH